MGASELYQVFHFYSKISSFLHNNGNWHIFLEPINLDLCTPAANLCRMIFAFCSYYNISKFSHFCFFDIEQRRLLKAPQRYTKATLCEKSFVYKLQHCRFWKRRCACSDLYFRRTVPVRFFKLNACLTNNTNSSEEVRTSFVDFQEEKDNGFYELEQEQSIQDEDNLWDTKTLDFEENYTGLDKDDFLVSEKLVEYLKSKQTETQRQPEYPLDKSAILDWWVAGVDSRKFKEIQNLYGNFGIFFLENFPDFTENKRHEKKLSPRDKAIFKAKKLYSSIGVPAIADSLLFVIEPAGSQGYQFEQLDANVDRLLEMLRTTSKPDRVTTFYSYVAYYDGERELVEEGVCEVDIYFAHTSHSSIAISTAFDNLMLRLRTELHLPAYRPDDELEGSYISGRAEASVSTTSPERALPGAALLADRLLREADLLQGSLIKVTAFLNHQVDVSLMESCGKDLTSLLASTNPTKILTIETSGLLPAITVARELNLLMVYARHGKSITMSDCIHTFYRSQTKGELYELVISKEYLGENDRVVIIDDFLAGGSTLDALIRLANMAGAEVCGVGVLIERTDMGGRAFLSGYDIPIFSLVRVSVSSEGLQVDSIENG